MINKTTSVTPVLKPVTSGKSFTKSIYDQRHLMTLTLPAVVWMLIFCYIPMYGIIIAFKEYDPILGFMKSPWTGLANFKELFTDPQFAGIILNTIKISIAKLVFGFPMPIIFAILLNELQQARFKKTVQTFSYLPYFISWVFVVGFMYTLLDTEKGAVGTLLVNLHMISKETMLMGSPDHFLALVVISDIWKNLGWNSIIFLAAITSVDAEQYEAALVDGAGRFRRIWHITLPSIKPTVVVLLIFSISGLFNANFDQLFMMKNSMTQDAANVIGIYAYQMGVVLGRFSYGTAVGLFQSIVSVLLLVIANITSKKLTEESLF